MNLNLLLMRRGKPYVGSVCWAHPELCKDVKRPGYYAVKVGKRNGDLVHKRVPIVPDGAGGWLYG